MNVLGRSMLQLFESIRPEVEAALGRSQLKSLASR
jgi:hypothetical protein